MGGFKCGAVCSMMIPLEKDSRAAEGETEGKGGGESESERCGERIYEKRGVSRMVSKVLFFADGTHLHTKR